MQHRWNKTVIPLLDIEKGQILKKSNNVKFLEAHVFCVNSNQNSYQPSLSIRKISEILQWCEYIVKFPFPFLPVKICTWSVFFCFLKTDKMFFFVSNEFLYVNYKNPRELSFRMFAVSDLVHGRNRLNLAFIKNLFSSHEISLSLCLFVFHKVSVSSCLKSWWCFA